MRAAFAMTTARNVPVAVAAGNSSVDLGTYFTQPSSLGESIPGVVTVGSFDSTKKMLSSFSNYGVTGVEIAAPGTDILSTINEAEDDPAKPNDPNNTRGYGILSGTSMASPQVAGAMALAVSYLRSHNISYTAADIENLIVQSAQPTNSLMSAGKDKIKNHGLLNLKNLALALKAKVAGTPAMAKMSPLSAEARAKMLKDQIRKTSYFDCP